jgi:hypothetical protein
MGTTQSATARLEAGRVAPRRSLLDRLADQTSPVVSRSSETVPGPARGLAGLAMALEQMRDLGRSDMGIGSAHLGGGSGWRVDVGQLGAGAAQR